MKVYCKDCKWYMDMENGYGLCFKNPDEKDTPISISRTFKDVYEKNAHNDCTDWSPNLRYRLARWLRRER